MSGALPSDQGECRRNLCQAITPGEGREQHANLAVRKVKLLMNLRLGDRDRGAIEVIDASGADEQGHRNEAAGDVSSANR